MVKATARNSITEAVLETANDLHDLGLITSRRLKEYYAIGAPSAAAFKPSKIAKLRKASSLSQAAFALTLGVSVSAVRQWERGEKTPGGPSLRLLQLVEKNGIQLLLRLSV